MTAAIALTLLALVCLAGLLLVVYQLPGTWLILVAAIAFDWHAGWQKIGVTILLAIAGMAVVAEILEFLMTALVAGKAGASRRAAWFALAGGLLGAFLFTIPVPVLGTIAGAIIGCFVGAVIGEMTLHDKLDTALKVGFASALGRAMGFCVKLAIAMAMSAAALAAAIL